MSETIEQMTYRLMVAAVPRKDFPSFDVSVKSTFFHNMSKIIELAIAEERDACARICDELWRTKEMGFAKHYECATAIRSRGAAPKDEVSE